MSGETSTRYRPYNLPARDPHTPKYAERESSGGESSDEEPGEQKEEEPEQRAGYSMQVPAHRKCTQRGENKGWAWEQVTPTEMAKWTEPPVGRAALRSMTEPVTLVWKVTSTNRIPWVIVAESAHLRKSGQEQRNREKQMGLYAWRKFGKDEEIAKYEGERSEVYKKEDVQARAIAEKRVKGAGVGDMTLEVSVTGKKGERCLINGEQSGAPFLQRANDGRGLTNSAGQPARNTAYVNKWGTMRSARKGDGPGTATRWGTMTAAGGWAQMETREIMWAYGKEYWAGKLVGRGDTGKGSTATEAQSTGNTEEDTEEYLCGTLWYDIGYTTALCIGGEERKRTKV